MRFFLFLLLVIPQFAHAGAWLQKKGQGEIIMSYDYFYTNEFFNEFGDRTISADFGKSEVTAYGEYGLHEDWTLGAAASFQSVINVNNNYNADNFKFSYIDVFARTYLHENEYFVVSAEPRIHIPIEADASLNPEGEDIIPELKISIGAPFKMLGQYSFIDLSAKYRYRDEDDFDRELEDMVKYEASLGLKLLNDWMLLGQIFHEDTLNRRTGDTTPGNYELTKAQASIIEDYWETLFLQYSIYSNISGSNTVAGDGVQVSVWYKF